MSAAALVRGRGGARERVGANRRAVARKPRCGLAAGLWPDFPYTAVPPTLPPVRRVVLALGLASAGFACFTGEALVGEPCADDSDCGPKLACNEDGLCDEFHCPGALSIEVDNFAPDVMVLVDYAISMNKDVEGTGLSRWDFAYEVVRRISEETGPHVNLGVLRIPTTESGNRPCVTSPEGLVAPGADQGAAVLATLPVAEPDRGEHALRRGLEISRAALEARPNAGYRTQAIVLISDGPFNCSALATVDFESVSLFDADLAATAAAASAAGIGVYVVGVDVKSEGGGEPAPGKTYEEVDSVLAFRELAEAGGRPRDDIEASYYTPGTLDELIDELDALPDAFADCTIELDEKLAYPERLVINVDGANHKLQASCDDGHGWLWQDAGQRVIQLCSDTCDKFRVARKLTIDLRCVVP